MRSSVCSMVFLCLAIGLYLPDPAGAQTVFDETLVGIDAFGGSAFYCGLASDLGLSVTTIDSSMAALSRSDRPTGGGLAGAFENKLQIGGRFGIFVADGEPANDMMMYGVYGRYRLHPSWHWGFGVDFFSFDFERPYRILGLKSTMENPEEISESKDIIYSDLVTLRKNKEEKDVILSGSNKELDKIRSAEVRNSEIDTRIETLKAGGY